jgi:hypothetical protein
LNILACERRLRKRCHGASERGTAQNLYHDRKPHDAR